MGIITNELRDEAGTGILPKFEELTEKCGLRRCKNITVVIREGFRELAGGELGSGRVKSEDVVQHPAIYGEGAVVEIS